MVEYIGHVADDELQGLTPGQQKARLVAAVKAARDRQVGSWQDMPGITGMVTV